MFRLACPALVTLLLLQPGCARYIPTAMSIPASAARLPEATHDPLDFDTALGLLVTRHPRLEAARAHARALNLTPGPSPLVTRARSVEGDLEELTLETDLLSLLGLGPRPKAAALAHAVRDRRLYAYQQTARMLAAELAEAFAVERALRDHVTPEPEIDLAAFKKAGLVSESSQATTEAIRAEAAAEARILSAAHADAVRRIIELTGARPTEAPPTISAVGEAWPALPEASDRQMILARGDVLERFAAFHEADRAYQLAVAQQIPTLELRLGELIELDRPLQLLRVRIPLDAADEALAAHTTRCAAAARLEDALLGALHDDASARLALESARAERDSAEAAQRASQRLRRAERGRLETSPEAFTTWVIAWGQEVRAARALRKARVQLARARVAAARAAGWPTRAEMPWIATAEEATR